MKYFVLSFLLTSQSFAANINSGNVEAGGAFDLTFGEGYTSFTLAPDLQYFFFDKFSAGLEGYVSTFTGTKATYGVGPKATLYFATSDTLAPYVSLTPINFNFYPGLTLKSTSVSSGVKFFLTESVAFGPAVGWTHRYKSGAYRSRDTWSIFGVFSIHL